MESPILSRSFVISNGRCGSTMLSDLIAEQSDTLSVQEFFMSVPPGAKTDDVITGAEYWAMLSSPKPELTTLVRIGLAPKEMRYPENGRWAGNLEELPRVLAITLSKISSDPDGLFDLLAEQVPDFPQQSVGAHHQMFLDLLTRLTGKKRWVERSGGSSHVAPYVLRAFPTARVVHLTRNWQDSAVSMSKHPSFQLIQLRVEFLRVAGFDPFRRKPEHVVPAEMERFLPERLTAEALRERSQQMSRYLALCAFLEHQAEQALVDVPPQHLLEMRYEDLLAEPVEQLGRLGQFLEFEDWQDWADRVADRIRVPSSAGRVPAPA
jgi:putative sulfotransferase